jgi:hypothetical protein
MHSNVYDVFYSLNSSLNSHQHVSAAFAVIFRVKVKVKESRNRPGVAQRVPGDSGSQIS